jgi:hypothetical protein
MANKMFGAWAMCCFSGIDRQPARSKRIISGEKSLLYFMIFDITGSVYNKV